MLNKLQLRSPVMIISLSSLSINFRKFSNFWNNSIFALGGRYQVEISTGYFNLVSTIASRARFHSSYILSTADLSNFDWIRWKAILTGSEIASVFQSNHIMARRHIHDYSASLPICLSSMHSARCNMHSFNRKQ